MKTMKPDRSIRRVLYLARATVVPCTLVMAIMFGAARPAAAQPTISAPTNAFTGQPVSFVVNFPGAPGPGVLTFGDASSQPVSPPFPKLVQHVYALPGVYTARITFGFATASTTLIVSVLPTARVPVGTIYSAIPAQGTVLAGRSTSILVAYRIITPSVGISATNAPALEAVVVLEDSSGRLTYRNDPIVLPYSAFAGANIQTVRIPYVVPSDASGRYKIQVYLRAPGLGGTVAIGPASVMSVTGMPDPQPKIASQIHASGSIIAGPTTGGANALQATLNANFKMAYEEPTYVLGAGTTFDSTSRHVDPLLTLDPPSPGPVAAPDQATTQVSQAPPRYHDVIGHVTADLPGLVLSGGENLRGLDATENNSGWTYHAAAGFTQISSGTSGGQEGDLFDVARMFGPASVVRFAFINNVDDPNNFVSLGGNGPLSAKTGVAEFDEHFSSSLGLQIAGASSSADPLVAGKEHGAADKADAADLKYQAGKASLDVGYFNFGPGFATANGLGSNSDDAGGQAQLSLALSQLSTLAVQYNRDDRRDASSSASRTIATYATQSATGMQLSFGGERDQSDTPISATTTRQANFSLVRPFASGATVSLNGSVSGIDDAIRPSTNGVTRTGAFQFGATRGSANYSIALTGTNVSSSSPTATTTEAFTMTMPLVHQGIGPNGSAPGFSESHGADLQLGLTNTNNKALTQSTRSFDAMATVTFHFGSHVTLGIVDDNLRNTDVLAPANDKTLSSLRVSLGLMY